MKMKVPSRGHPARCRSYRANHAAAFLAPLVLALAAVLMSAGCAVEEDETGSAEHGDASVLVKAIAILEPTEGNTAAGQVTFTETAEGILVDVQVTGLAPGKHGFHIHEFGDITSPDGNSAGGHFNPTGQAHAGPDAENRHVGDLGNLEADEQGHATATRLDKVIQLAGEYSILGRAVVIHGGEDDLSSQPTGNAGNRAAVGVIGLANAY